jgi:glycosyltransferase involved in cell wall biosynthesis
MGSISFGKLGSWINSVSSFPAFINPRWILHIFCVCRNTTPDLILVRDLPLAPAALWISRLFRIPIVMDMAENYPAFLESLRETGTLNSMDLLIRSPTLARWVERYVIRRLSGIICVIEESVQRLIGLGIASDKIFLVRNTPYINTIPPESERNNADLTIAYLGLVERHRGVHELVQAAYESRRQGKPLRIVVVGDGRGLDELRHMSIKLGVLGNGVELLGRITNRDALKLISNADIGAIPHMPCEAWNTTIPNKLFDYMSMGLPILSSNVLPLQRIISETQCGLIYEWGNIPDLMAKIEVLRTADTRYAMGRAGRTAVLTRYNWSKDGCNLAQSIEKIAIKQRVT